MSDQEKKNKRKGLITSLTIHALLLLAFAFLGMTYVYPPPEEGMMINFGNMETGLGEVESEPAESAVVEEEIVEEVTPTETVEETPVETEVEEEVVTQEMLEAIALKKAEKKKQREEAEKRAQEERRLAEEQRIKEEKAAKLNSLFDQAKKGQGTGEGNTQPGGNQGSQDGTPGAPDGLGGSGVGYELDLGGRRAVKPPKFIYHSEDEGDVVVDIWVDRSGNVIKATPGARGTTAPRSLYKSAETMAYSMKFTADPKGSIEQKGTVSFSFRLE
jgi:protein TonB